MKKILLLLVVHAVLVQCLVAQNVGIGNTTPLTKLDVNGDIAFRSADITITTVYNYALDVNTVKQSHYKLKSPILPIGNFTLSGITAGTDGREITLTNYSGVSMEIYDEDVNANANDRIRTGIGTTLAVFPNGSVMLQYDVPEQRWLVKGGHNNSLSYFGGGGGGTSYWNLSGSNIINTNTGNVGIGVANPNFKLDIAGDQRTVGTATSAGAQGYITGGGVSRIENASNGFFLKMDGGSIQCEKPKPNGISGSSVSNLLINPYGGNVGIGTATPDFALTVKSTVVQANTNTQLVKLAGQNPLMAFSDGTTDFGYIKAWTYQPYAPFTNGLIIGSTPGYPIFFSTNNYSASMTIADNGNVGIGTTSPTYKLAVKGKIRSEEIVVETGWADYVFEDDYKLPSLESVEHHIKTNRHLPGMPSADNIQKQGLSVGAVQTKMMEKIEELTLYVIELKKEIESIKNKK